jgi:hypothetical protein
MLYVISCGDEGVQLNEGTRLGVVGSGFKLEGFSEVASAMKRVFGDELRIAAAEENDWIREKLELANWEQTNASAQQRIEALADQNSLLYAGIIPFADPQALAHDVRAHMVRPHGIHIANKIKLTLGGGEQTYNLGCYIISADWVSEADDALVKRVISEQIAFYTKLSKRDSLPIELELAGELGDERAQANKAKLEQLGLV